ncbi:MAG TPA: putative lipid II flippase FtsW [Actinomycetota bacterium]|nr:putative lipid II flippase FtsW [Actinomycetota bacterium]
MSTDLAAGRVRASTPRVPRAAKIRTPATYRLQVATTIALLAIGLVMVLSASSVESFTAYGSSFLYFRKQLLGAAIGVVVMAVVARLDYRRLRALARPLFWVTLAALLAALVPGIGISGGGSSRWLGFGPITVQPSELAKLSLILVAAHVLERKGRWVGDLRELTVPALPMTAIACGLMLLQPDLGTAIIAAVSVAVVLYLAGARIRHLGAILAGAGACGALYILSKPYQRARLTAFLNPWANPLKGGYQIIQGQIALGSGGWFGVGLGASRQKWSYVPNAHTDFIFAIIGEELGLVGTLLVLGAFAFFLYLGIRTAREAPDRFGFLVAGGITAWIGIQAVINVGAVTGMLPITGVPLPLISFGSTSLVVTLAAIGLLLSIARLGGLARAETAARLAEADASAGAPAAGAAAGAGAEDAD